MSQGFHPYPAPTPPQGSGAGRALKIALLIAIPLVLLVMVAIGGFAYAIFQATGGPRDAAHAFLRDARSGDWDAAYDRMSAGYQGRVDRADFESDIDTVIPAAADSDDATFNQTNISGNIACLSGWLSPGNDSIHVQLQKKGDAWKIEQIGRLPSPSCAHR